MGFSKRVAEEMADSPMFSFESLKEFGATPEEFFE